MGRSTRSHRCRHVLKIQSASTAHASKRVVGSGRVSRTQSSTKARTQTNWVPGTGAKHTAMSTYTHTYMSVRHTRLRTLPPVPIHRTYSHRPFAINQRRLIQSTYRPTTKTPPTTTSPRRVDPTSRWVQISLGRLTPPSPHARTCTSAHSHSTKRGLGVGDAVGSAGEGPIRTRYDTLGLSAKMNSSKCVSLIFLEKYDRTNV